MTKQKSILDTSNFSQTFATRRERRKVCHARNEISIRDLVNLGSRVDGGAVGKHVASLRKNLHTMYSAVNFYYHKLSR